MSLIEEYGERKFQRGFEKGLEIGRKKIIVDLLQSGMSAEEISQMGKVNLEDVLKIKSLM